MQPAETGRSPWWQARLRPRAERGLRLSVIVPLYNERYLVGAVIERLLGVEIPSVTEMEIVVVDDASDDGSAEIVERLVEANPDRVRLIRKPHNEGKGSAIRAGVAEANGDLIVIQDADLEYDPRDLERLVGPFVEKGADVVYGSRFAGSSPRRVLYFRHELGNRLITFLSNLFTDLNLTDVETCYKMFRGPLLQSIPIRSNDFGVEIELTAKIAKRHCRVYEVPISYHGRTYGEGKKITWRDGARALVTILRYWLVDDLYKDDPYGKEIVHNLERAHRFNRWLADSVVPWVGGRVLEIAAGIGNVTQCLIPRDRYVATDWNADYLHYLRNFAVGKPYLEVAALDPEQRGELDGLEGAFDTVVCLSALEHMDSPLAALGNMRRLLAPGGRLVLYVPRGRRLYCGLDEALGHRRRYDRESLTEELESAELRLEHLSYFNRVSVVGWWWNGKILRRQRFGRGQLKALDFSVPLLRRIDRLLPWKGLGIIAVARRPERDAVAAATAGRPDA